MRFRHLTGAYYAFAVTLIELEDMGVPQKITTKLAEMFDKNLRGLLRGDKITRAGFQLTGADAEAVAMNDYVIMLSHEEENDEGPELQAKGYIE